MKRQKKLLRFETEAEEPTFWANHDATDYVDFPKARRAVFPKLRPSTKTISIRLPESLIEHLKMLANKRDVPYQTLLKFFLAEKVREEMGFKNSA